MHHWVKKHIHRSWLARISHMSSAHCNCLPLAELGVNYAPSGSKQKKTKMHKFLHPALLASLSPHGNTEKNQPSTSLQGPANPTKCTSCSGCRPVILEKTHGISPWVNEEQRWFWISFCRPSVSPFPISGSLFLWEQLEQSAALSAVVSSAPGLTFPGEGADPEAQAPAWALPLPIPSWLCAFHTLSANLDLKSCLNHRNCSYSSSTQRNQHQYFQSKIFTLMQLVKSR